MDEVGEAEVLDCAAAGRALDCGAGGIRRVLDAALVRRLCLGLRDRVDPRGLRLANAAVAGQLDLAGLDVPFSLRFEGCEFDSALVVEGARLAELAVTGCPRLPGLLGNGARVGGNLDLSRSRLLGAQDDVEGARAAYQQAIDSQHSEAAPTAAVGLGILLANRGDVEGARAAYQQAIKSGDEDISTTARRFLRELSKRSKS